MTTKALLKSPAPVASLVANMPRSRRGRPRSVSLALSVADPQDARRVLSIPADRLASWCGVSRQTAARWCRDPSSLPTAAARLVALYAHGRPPIPPDCLGQDGAAGWLQFAFYFERNPAWAHCPGGRWLLALPGQRPANWQQVHALFVSLPALGQLAADLTRWRERAEGAEAEAARWRDLVASGI